MRQTTQRPINTIKVTRLPKDKDQQVTITVREMIRITCLEGWAHDLRWLAAHWKLPHYTQTETAEAYTTQIRRRVQFEFDPEDIELLRTPSYYARAIRQQQAAAGDCDDMALLLGTLLYSQGFNVAYVVMATSPIQREFQHVFTAVRISREWRFYDPSIARGYSTDGLRRRWFYVPFGHGPPAI